MEILLAILCLLLVVLGYFFYSSNQQVQKLKQEKTELERQAILLSKKELEYLDFVIYMYVKYAKELKINSPDQHDFIVSELDRISASLKLKINSLSEGSHPPSQESQ